MSRRLLFTIFIIALVARLWFNFVDPHVNNAGAADGSEYLRNARALGEVLSNWPFISGEITSNFFQGGSGHLSHFAKDQIAKLSGFSQSGPIFPGFILLSWLFTGSTYGSSGWVAPVFVQSVISAVACIFLALTGERVWNARAGIFAGFFSALYPAYIVNSGRLYTESFATSICCFIIFSLVIGFTGGRRRRLHILFLGIALAVLQLTRSVMVVLSLVVFPLTFFHEHNRSAKSKVLALLLGMSCVLVPWLIAQKVIFGKTSLVVDRVGNYNLFVGTNSDISGWLSYPYPDGRGVEARPALKVLSDNFKRSPERFLKLMTDKPQRLFKFPWNDFRTPIGPFSFWSQVIFHQVLLCLFVCGLCLTLVKRKIETAHDSGVQHARYFIFLYFLAHCIYFLFITVPRYNLTATPALILFAAAGASAVFGLAYKNYATYIKVVLSGIAFFLVVKLSEPGGFVPLCGGDFGIAIIALTAAKVAFAVVFFAYLYELSGLSKVQGRLPRRSFALCAVLSTLLATMPVRANGRPGEWMTTLSKPSDKISQTIELNSEDREKLSGQAVYLLIDTTGARALSQHGLVKVNGQNINTALIPGISLTQDFSAVKLNGKSHLYYECEWIYDCMTVSAGLSNLDLRQWYWLRMPPDVVASAKTSGRFDIEIENKDGKMPINIFGAHLNKNGIATLPSIESSSWEKAFYGVENDKGLTCPRYDFKIDLTKHSQSSVNTREIKSHSGAYSLLILTAPLAKPGTAAPVVTIDQLPSQQYSVKPGEQRNFSLQSKFQNFQNQMVIVRLKGYSSALAQTKVHPVILLSVCLKNGLNVSYPVRWMPRELPSDLTPTAFDYSFPLMPSLITGDVTSINVSFLPEKAGATLEIRDLKMDVTTLDFNPLAFRTSLH